MIYSESFQIFYRKESAIYLKLTTPVTQENIKYCMFYMLVILNYTRKVINVQTGNISAHDMFGKQDSRKTWYFLVGQPGDTALIINLKDL